MKTRNEKTHSRAFTSALIFLSTVLLGSTWILAATNLDTLKSGANQNMLTARNRDILIDEIKEIWNNTSSLGKEIAILHKEIKILKRKSTTTLWKKNWNNVFITGVNIGIGTNTPSTTIEIQGNTKLIWWPNNRGNKYNYRLIKEITQVSANPPSGMSECWNGRSGATIRDEKENCYVKDWVDSRGRNKYTIYKKDIAHWIELKGKDVIVKGDIISYGSNTFKGETQFEKININSINTNKEKSIWYSNANIQTNEATVINISQKRKNGVVIDANNKTRKIIDNDTKGGKYTFCSLWKVDILPTGKRPGGGCEVKKLYSWKPSKNSSVGTNIGTRAIHLDYRDSNVVCSVICF